MPLPPKICIKYRKHGSFSFSYTFNCVYFSPFWPKKKLNKKKFKNYWCDMYYATFKCGRYNVFKPILNLIFVHEKLKNPCSKLAYFSFCLAVSVLPKTARSAQTVENSHSFFNVSYTWYKNVCFPQTFLEPNRDEIFQLEGITKYLI